LARTATLLRDLVAKFKGQVAGSLYAFDGEGDALADADAHGGESAAATGFLQLVDGGEDKPRAAHAERVTERDGSAVGIDVRCVVGETQLAQTGE